MLTDESKREMQGAIGPGATPGQIKAALDVFRTDARNRKASYEASIADLTGRSVSGGHGTEPPPTETGTTMRREQTSNLGNKRHTLDGGKTWQPGPLPAQ